VSDLEQRFLAEVMEDLEAKRLVLPTLPEVALRVREVVDNPDASVSDLTKVIGTDAALTARLIQVANSPLMRAGRQIQTLDMAVARLGMKLVRDLATSMVMQQMFQATSEFTDEQLRRLWQHHIDVASIAHVLAAQFTRLNAEEAMLAGLIHDIGALPILTKAEEQPEVLEDPALFRRLLWKLHPRVGEAILTAWNFAPELVKVAAEHENVFRDSAQLDYVDVIIVANLQSYAGSSHPLAKVDWDKVPAFSKLGLSTEMNVIEMEETADDIREAQRLLQG